MDYRSHITYFEYEKTCEAQRVEFLWYGFGLGVVKSLSDALSDVINKDILITNLYGLEELAQLTAKRSTMVQSKTIILLSCLANESLADKLSLCFNDFSKIYRDHNCPEASLQELQQLLHAKTFMPQK